MHRTPLEKNGGLREISAHGNERRMRSGGKSRRNSTGNGGDYLRYRRVKQVRLQKRIDDVCPTIQDV